MTIDEHMYVKNAIQDVRDALQARRHHEAQLPALVATLDACLAVLRRPSVLRALHPPTDTATREEAS